MEATLCRAWFDQVLTDTLAAAESLLRDWWSNRPRRRPLENRSGGKQEACQDKANCIVTPVAGRQRRSLRSRVELVPDEQRVIQGLLYILSLPEREE